MKITCYILLFVAYIGQDSKVQAGKSTSLPKEFTLCPPADDECLRKAISSALVLLKTGMPKVGLPVLDPIHVTEMVIGRDSGPVSLLMVLKNFDFSGVSDMVLTSAKGEFGDKTYRLEMEGKIPMTNLFGDYTINGKIMVLPITGEGIVNSTFYDMDISMLITGHVTDKSGVEYVEIDDLVSHFKYKLITCRFENLFGGNKQLGDAMNDFINENWKEISEELKPPFEEATSAVFKELTHRFYKKVPYRKIHAKPTD